MLGFHPLSSAPLSSLGLAMVVAADVGSYAVAGQDATWDRGIAHDAGAYAVTGQDAELDPSLFFRCQTGDYYVTGGAATFRLTQASEAGAYALAGQDAGLVYGRVLAADAGPYDVTGQGVIFRIGVALIGDVGTYTVTGQDAAARYVLRGDAAVFVNPSTDGPMSSLPMSSLGATHPDGLAGYVLGGYHARLALSRLSGAGAYVVTGFPTRFIRGPVIRARGRDLSAALVLQRDLSAGFIFVRDTSEGLP